MEPIGFAASLITVVGLVTASSRKIHDLRGKLRNAPKDVEDLLEQVQTFENLLNELKTQLQDHRNSIPPQETLQRVWGSSIAQMQQDVQSLQTVLSKVELLLKKKSKSSKILLLARHVLSEKEVERYQRKIDIHCGTLTNIQAMVCSRKLGKVSESITQLGDEDRAGFQTLSSQISQTANRLNSEVKAGFSTVSSQHTVTESANETRHQMVLAHLDAHAKRDDVISEKMDESFERHVRSMDLNEAGFQAVRSSLVAASSSSSEDHKTTHAMLSQFQGQWQQVLRNHITFGTIGDVVRSSTLRARASNPITETTVFWKYSFYRMPIGMLNIRLNKRQQSKNSSRSTSQVCTDSEIELQFVPPRWLSRVVINYSMKLSYELISDEWHWGATLRPLTVNYNPFFINAAKSCDVEGVRRSFAEGLARPTDHLSTTWGSPLPWYKFFGLGNRCNVTQSFLLIDFMVNNGLPGQELIIRDLSARLRFGYPEDQDRLRNQLQRYSKRAGKVLAADSRVFDWIFMYTQVGRIGWIPDYLLNPLEPWLVDDLSSSQICLIGTLAQVDAVFSDRLKKELASYRSPASAGRPYFGDYLFETIFSTASIERHFRKLECVEIYKLMSLLCRTGSTTMLKPFMDIGVDVNGGGSHYNMLGCAAAEGNMDIVYMLLEAGANGSLAIKTFLPSSKYLSDALFGSLIELLVENARPARFDESDDPLLAIIQSSRALCSYPKAPEIFLDRKVFTKGYFGEGASKNHYHISYMYHAISSRNSSLVNLLLQNGARADARISHLFDCFYHDWIGECTWITFSVACGTASCTDVLIQHGADVTALDGAGRSALQLARNHALGSHPRKLKYYHTYGEKSEYVTAEEDAEILAVVEWAFNLKFQGTKSLDDYFNVSNEVAPQPPSPRDRLTSQPEKMLGKALGVIFTPSQTKFFLRHFRALYQDAREIWSLSFSEALLMRFFYVLSYALLLAYELHALIKGHKRIPMPSRFFLSALAILALALILGSSQGGFSWGLFTAGTKA